MIHNCWPKKKTSKQNKDTDLAKLKCCVWPGLLNQGRPAISGMDGGCDDDRDEGVEDNEKKLFVILPEKGAHHNNLKFSFTRLIKSDTFLFDTL